MSDSLQAVIDGLRSLLTWWVVVMPWEQAIRVRGGWRVRLLSPGLYLRVPVLDRVFRQSVRLRTISLPSQTLTTRDGKVVTVAVTVDYRIANLLLLYETMQFPDATISRTAMGRITTAIAVRCFDECSIDELSSACQVGDELAECGLSDVRVTVTAFVAGVRTYRLITGDGETWMRTTGGPLNTINHDGERPQE